MRETEAQNLIRMFGGLDSLVGVLRITEYPKESQLEIVTRFSEHIFKRILLHVPREYVPRVIDVLDAHREEGSDFEELIIILDQHIPSSEISLRKEVEQAIAHFRVSL